MLTRKAFTIYEQRNGLTRMNEECVWEKEKQKNSASKEKKTKQNIWNRVCFGVIVGQYVKIDSRLMIDWMMGGSVSYSRHTNGERFMFWTIQNGMSSICIWNIVENLFSILFYFNSR